MAENADKMKAKLIKAQNTFNTTTASTNNFKTSDTTLSKHKRSKTQNSTGKGDNDGSSSYKSDKTKDFISQMKADFRTFYDKPSRKTVYVNKAQVKKQNKPCSSTGGSKMGGAKFK